MVLLYILKSSFYSEFSCFLFILYEYINNTMCSIGVKCSSTCKTVPFCAGMCYRVKDIFCENKLELLFHWWKWHEVLLYYWKQRPKLTSVESLKDLFLAYLTHYSKFLTWSCTWSLWQSKWIWDNHIQPYSLNISKTALLSLSHFWDLVLWAAVM